MNGGPGPGIGPMMPWQPAAWSPLKPLPDKPFIVEGCLTVWDETQEPVTSYIKMDVRERCPKCGLQAPVVWERIPNTCACDQPILYTYCPEGALMVCQEEIQG